MRSTRPSTIRSIPARPWNARAFRCRRTASRRHWRCSAHRDRPALRRAGRSGARRRRAIRQAASSESGLQRQEQRRAGCLTVAIRRDRHRRRSASGCVSRAQAAKSIIGVVFAGETEIVGLGAIFGADQQPAGEQHASRAFKLAGDRPSLCRRRSRAGRTGWPWSCGPCRRAPALCASTPWSRRRRNRCRLRAVPPTARITAPRLARLCCTPIEICGSSGPGPRPHRRPAAPWRRTCPGRR